MNDIASNGTFITAAYAVTWIVLLGYLVRLLTRGRRARAEANRVSGGAGQERVS